MFRKVVEGATLNVTRVHIWVGNESVSSPVINSHQAGYNNNVVITGNFTREQARELQLMIESGLFEAQLVLSEISIIAPN